MFVGKKIFKILFKTAQYKILLFSSALTTNIQLTRSPLGPMVSESFL